jgi:hypothetical protein
MSVATVIPLPSPSALEGMTTRDLESELLGLAGHEIHDHGFLIRWPAGRSEFRRPDGTPIPTTGAPLTGNTESLIEMHTRARLRIDRITLTPDWDGDRLDPEPILDALLPRRVKTAA